MVTPSAATPRNQHLQRTCPAKQDGWRTDPGQMEGRDTLLLTQINFHNIVPAEQAA